MRKLLWLVLCFPILTVDAQKSEFTIKELVFFTNIPTNKFSTYITRKGYKPRADDTVEREYLTAYHKISKDKAIEKLVGRYDKNDTAAIFYQTNSKFEFDELKLNLEEDGFEKGFTDSVKRQLPAFYQRGNITIIPVVKKEDEKENYGFTVERKELPKASEILYAEDLLKITSVELISSPLL